jgi:hypothetical protein
MKAFFSPLLGKRMLICAVIGLVLISFFVIGAGEGSPEWGKNWRIKPLVLTPFLCALVGLCYDITEPLRKLGGWRGSVLFILSIIGVLIGFWLSLILGLNGTMWD